MSHIDYMLGQLMERTDRLIITVSQHQSEMGRAMNLVQRRLSRLERKPQPPLPEVLIKRVLILLLPAGTFIFTGSAEKAWEVVKMIFADK